MARRRKSRVSTRKLSPGQDLVIVEQPAAPAATSKRGGIRRRMRRAGIGGRSAKKKTMMGAALGGLIFGFIEKNFADSLPTMPVIGKSGTIALGCYFFGGTNEIVNDVGVAAATIAGYTLATTGTISGDYDHGLASEA